MKTCTLSLEGVGRDTPLSEFIEKIASQYRGRVRPEEGEHTKGGVILSMTQQIERLSWSSRLHGGINFIEPNQYAIATVVVAYESYKILRDIYTSLANSSPFPEDIPTSVDITPIRVVLPSPS